MSMVILLMRDRLHAGMSRENSDARRFAREPGVDRYGVTHGGCVTDQGGTGALIGALISSPLDRNGETCRGSTEPCIRVQVCGGRRGLRGSATSEQ